MGRRPRDGSVDAWVTARWRFEARAFDACAVAARALPVGLRPVAGAALGMLLWAVDRRHVRTAADNLRHVYGDDLSPDDVRRTVRRCFRHFALAALDLLALDHDHVRAASRFRIEGLEHGLDAIAKGRGVLFFSAHLGMWEFAALLGGLTCPLSVVARPLDNPLLERRLTAIRTRWGNRVIAKRGAVAEVAADLRAGRAVAMLIDQRPRSTGMVLPFLGRDAHVRPTLAILALRTGAPILPARCRRDPDGTWRFIVGPEVAVEPSGDAAGDAARIMSACNAHVERWIRECPEQWLWTHARWREPRSRSSTRSARARVARAVPAVTGPSGRPS